MTKAGTLVAVAIAVLASASVQAQSTAERSSSPAPAATSGRSCESLASLALPHVKITSAEAIAAGAFKAPNAGRGAAAFAQLPAFCRVAATLTPAPDSDIKMEIWLPAENWNGKFLAVGNGGWAGTISLDAVATGLRRGYAAASNDTGHSDASAGAQFALSQDKLVDFAYRAMHEMTVQSKTIVGAFYNRPPRLSYYQGCSTGGRQGMMEAQRFPDDFDAIVAGAPVYNMVHMNVTQTALQVEMLKNPERIVPPGKVTLVATAATAACDANDGVKDGIISEPLACKFDPGVLACKAGDGPDCLTAGQVASARQLYASVKTKSGHAAYPGRSPGVEPGWASRIPEVGKPVGSLWGDMPRFVGHRDATWDASSFDLDKDLALTLKELHRGERSGSLKVQSAWREAPALARVGRSWTRTAEHDQLLLTGREDIGRSKRRLDAAVPDAWCRALWRRSRARSGGLPGRDGTLARTGCCACADHRLTQRRPKRTHADDEASVPVPADRKIQRDRQH
jgi:Tannase and feruloyl esterase